MPWICAPASLVDITQMPRPRRPRWLLEEDVRPGSPNVNSISFLVGRPPISLHHRLAMISEVMPNLYEGDPSSGLEAVKRGTRRSRLRRGTFRSRLIGLRPSTGDEGHSFFASQILLNKHRRACQFSAHRNFVEAPCAASQDSFTHTTRGAWQGIPRALLMNSWGRCPQIPAPKDQDVISVRAYTVSGSGPRLRLIIMEQDALAGGTDLGVVEHGACFISRPRTKGFQGRLYAGVL